MDALPRPARWYLYGVWIAASIAVVLALSLAPAPGPALLLVGLVAFVLADYFAVELELDHQTEISMTCVDTAQVFLAATAGPWGVIVPFVGSLLSDALSRRAWYKGLFNAAQRSLAFLALVGVYQLVGAPWSSPFAGWPGLVALALMVAAYLVLNPLFVSAIVALSSGQSPLKVYAGSVSQVRWVHFMTLPLGAVLAVLWHYEPWMLLPAVLPLVMAYQSFKVMASLQHESRRSRAFAEQARQLADKLERLQDTTTAMLASDEPRPLLELVSERLAALLGAPAAWVILAKPAPHLVAARGLPDAAALDLGASLSELRHREVRQSLAANCCPDGAPWPMVLHIPMLTGGRLVGGFCLALPAPLSLAEDDRRVLLAFAAQTAVAVERTQLEDQLRTKQEELLRTSKLAAMGTLAAGIAHEFNNLLTAIAGFAQLGLTSDDPAEKDDALEVALRTSKRGHSITAGLLSFARKRETRRELCQLRDVVDETLLLVERQLIKANVNVRREYEPVPKTFCEPGQIAQVVMNLITNARDAMAEAQGGTLVLGLAPRDGQIELWVSDTGVGIPDELLPQIFQPFITTKAALDGATPPGTGLGLAITNGIIESHLGSIKVRSAVGQGTTVLVRLPVVTPEEEAARTSLEAHREVSA
ncbi:MAG TPA: ATP-binding protein [Chloroflexaceae bacterium]|nr:ATP-binding protein [Chloroflexaceae bacterium]